MTIEELKARRGDLLETAKAIQAKADAEKRDLSGDEATQLEGVFAEADRIKDDIARRERLAALEADMGTSAGRRAAPNPVQASAGDGSTTIPARSIQTPVRNATERNRWGWHNFGDFCAAVKTAGMGREVDKRLVDAATTYGNEGSGADGGFAVPPEFRSTIMQKVTAEDSLLSRCDQVQTGGYGITVPKDETAPWGTAGVQAYWDGEAATMTQKKHAFENSTIRVHKLTALVPVTDELLEDAPALGSYVQTRAGDVIDFKVTDAIINGSGAGQPLGVLNAACTVSQAAESSQAAGTIHGLNLVKMWGRMPARWRSTAVWLVHPDIEPLLMTAGLQVGNAAQSSYTGGQLIYMPPGGINGSPYSTLLGRPVLPYQSCQAPGTVGDIVLASMGQYAAVTKAGGVKSDSSIHLYFDQGVTAFRFTFRVGGQPWWSAAISAKNGSTTYGPFVTLAAR